jgi:hypothetical protein
MIRPAGILHTSGAVSGLTGANLATTAAEITSLQTREMDK